MHSAFSLSSIQSGFVSCKLFFMPVSSCLYFTQRCAFHLLMELGNEQLYENLLWRLLLDSERRPFHLRGRSQESLRFVTLHSPRVCARDRQWRRRETNRRVWGRFFYFLKVMRPAVIMITGASGEESWRRDQGIGLEKKERENILNNNSHSKSINRAVRVTNSSACLRQESRGTVISSSIKDMSSFFSLNNILQSLSEHLCVLSGTKKYLDT